MTVAEVLVLVFLIIPLVLLVAAFGIGVTVLQVKEDMSG